jgi:hypothetical protein
MTGWQGVLKYLSWICCLLNLLFESRICMVVNRTSFILSGGNCETHDQGSFTSAGAPARNGSLL